MKRFTIVQNGYNIEEVNRFIDIVIKRLEKLNNDNSLLQVKISSLEEQLKEKKTEEVKLSITNEEETSEAIAALQVLGYTKREIEKALENVDTKNLQLEDIIKQGLKNLARN